MARRSRKATRIVVHGEGRLISARELFSESFETEVPMAKVDNVIGGLQSNYTFVRIEERRRGYFMVFDHGEARARISMNTQHKSIT